MTDATLIGQRLRAWRQVINKRAKDLVKESEGSFGPHYWSQWENGKRRISIDHAIELCDRYPGITLDFIFRGQMGGMPYDLVEALRGTRIVAHPGSRQTGTKQKAVA